MTYCRNYFKCNGFENVADFEWTIHPPYVYSKSGFNCSTDNIYKIDLDWLS